MRALDLARPGPGRPRRVSTEQISATALRLFAERGFTDTTVDDIADELGVARRTIFRSFASKNDMVWGNFELVLARLRDELDAIGTRLPIMEAIARAVVASNRYPPEQLGELRTRMTLITSVPALQAHSMLRYADWRSVIGDYVAGRLGDAPTDLRPVTIAHASLAVSMAAFSLWVGAPQGELETILQNSWRSLSESFTWASTASGRLPGGSP